MTTIAEKFGAEEVKKRIKTVIASQLGLEESAVTDSAKLEDDLGADSLDQVELCMSIEDEFGMEIRDEDYIPLFNATLPEIAAAVGAMTA